MTDHPLLAAMAWLSAASQVLAAPADAPPAGARSPAQQKIAWAEAAVHKTPEHYRAYNDLASAQVRRAWETADPATYADAERAVRTSLSLVPNNFEARRIEVEILLGREEYASAAERSTALNRRVADDIPVYGLIADAAIGLGNYPEAEEAVQWMLNLRPPAPPGLRRAARLRELYGDHDGASELLRSAYEMTPVDEVADRAAVLTHLARLARCGGRLEAADELLSQAVELFPAGPCALVELGLVRSAQQRHAEAVALLRRAHEAAPRPESLYLLAGALARSGAAGDAAAAYADFERNARAAMNARANANRELAFYYADRAGDPAEALRVARLEVDAGGRHDVPTLHAHAWALHKCGDHAAALRQIKTALAVGVRDARMFYHAGEIARATRDGRAAAAYFKRSLDADATSEVASAAKAGLAAAAADAHAGEN